MSHTQSSTTAHAVHVPRIDQTPGYVQFDGGDWLSLDRYLHDWAAKNERLPKEMQVVCHAEGGTSSIQVAGLTLTSKDIPISYRLTPQEQEEKQKEGQLMQKIQEQKQRSEAFTQRATEEMVKLGEKQGEEQKQGIAELMRQNS